MPATLLSHQALVLPLKLRWPQRFSGLALCIGSMAPDLEFIARMSDDWLFSHTLHAQLWFTLPVTVLLHWLLTAVLLPALLPYLRDHPGLRLHDLAALAPPRSSAEWLTVCISAVIGGASHVVLDGITHGNHSGWLVPWLPFLRTPVPHPGGEVPLHDALQLWLTIGLAIVTAVLWQYIARHRLLWRWRAQRARALPRQPREEGHRLLVAALLFAALGGACGLGQQHPHPKAAAAAVAFGAIDATLAGLMLAALHLRRRTQGRPGEPEVGAGAG